MLERSAPSGPIDGAKPSAQSIFAKELRLDERVDDQRAPTEAQIALWESQLREGSFSDLETSLQNIAVSNRLLAWLEARAREGHVPMMWVLADRLARLQRVEASIYWVNAAMMATLQERELCSDARTESALPTLVDRHALSVSLSRSNPMVLRPAKQFAIQLISSIRSWPDPTPWLCRPFAGPSRPRDRAYVFDPDWFPTLRAQARNKLRDRLEIAGSAPEPVPPPPRK